MSLSQRAQWLRLDRAASMRLARACRDKGRPADWVAAHVARAQRIHRELLALLAVLNVQVAA